MRLLILSGLIILKSGIEAFAQNYKMPELYKATPLAPNATSLGRYGTYEVNYNTGLADISIPVFEINTGKLSLPVKLSYHSAGIKVNDVAGWAGLGWSLIAGGSVSRAVTGRPDESSMGYLDPTNTLRLGSGISGSVFSDYAYLNEVELGIRDYEPDMFSYNYPGGSGKFYFDRDKASLIKMPYDKEIITITKTIPGFFHEINITAKDGTIYKFGKTLSGADCVENGSYPMSYTSHGESYISVRNNWMLTAIISADNKDTIELKYVAGGSGYIADRGHSFTLYTENSNTGGSELPTTGTFNLNVKDVENYYTDQKLSEIIFRNGKVVFDAVQDRTDITNEKRLNQVNIYSKDPVTGSFKLIKSVKLFHSYYTGGQRLKLDSLHIKGNSAEILPYRFSYNSLDLPDRFSYQRDWWGYYNGAIGNVNLIPPIHILNGTGSGYFDFFTANNREVDPYYTQAGILNRIDYPTGGYTEFEYEPNKYLEGVTEKLAGGLRIKQIRSFPYAGAIALKKTIAYPYGQVNVPPAFSYLSQSYLIKKFIEIQVGGCTGATEWVKLNNFSSNPSVTLTDYDGNAVFYNTVTEYDGDQAINNGSAVYTYENYSDNVVNYVPPGKTYKENNFWRRSNLLQKSVYNNSNTLLAKTVNTYTDVHNVLYQSNGLLVGKWFEETGSSCFAGAPNCGSGDCTPPSLASKYNFTHYVIRTGLKKLQSTAEYVYDPANISNPLVKTTTYTYDASSNEPAEITQNNSTGETIFIKNKYPGNYTIPAGTVSNEAEGIRNLVNKNIIAMPVESYRQIQKSSGIVTTGSAITSFNPVFPLPAEAFMLQSSVPLTDFTPSYVSGTSISKDSRYASRLKFTLFDERNNIKEQRKTDDIIHSYIWDYQYSYLIAEVQNATASDIAYTSFEAEGKGNWTFNGITVADGTAPTGKKAYSLNGTNNITRTGLNSSTVYVVSYWTKNTSAFTITGTITGYPIQGRTINGWKYFEHKITGQTQVNIGNSGLIDEIRLYPDKSLMTTYTYEPLVGMKTQCDANNKILYYEYDGFGRLILIRDQDKNIVKKVCYNLAGQTTTCNIWYNAAASQNFTRNNCPSGYTASTVNYSVPDGIYVSTVSQADADAKAQADIAANGQAYANAVGTCTPPACTYANCDATAVNKRCVNGVCETGFKVYTDSYFDTAIHQWVCTYHWEWSDGVWSQNYTEYSPTICMAS